MSAEHEARIARMESNADAAEARGDRGTAARLREAAVRARRDGPPKPEITPPPAPRTPRAETTPPPEDGHTRLVTGTGPSPVVHLVVAPRRIRCRVNTDLVPTTRYRPTADAVDCKRCLAGVARDALAPPAAPPPAEEPAARDSPARRTGGADEGKPFRVTDPLPPLDDAPPLPPGERPTKGATAGDLAAALLGSAVDARRPLRVIGRLSASSTVGVMVSADGSVVLMGVD